MTKNRFWRIALCLALIITAIFCIAENKAQDNEMKVVRADNPCPVTNVFTEMEYYGLYAQSLVYEMTADDGEFGSLHICDIDTTNYTDYGGHLDVSLYKDGVLVCNWYYDNVSEEYRLIEGNGYEDYILVPGVYTYDIWWDTAGSYNSGYAGLNGDLSFTILPSEQSFGFTSTDFENCVYSEVDSAMFMNTPFVPYSDDDAELAWFYDDGTETIQITNETNVGTYYIYPKFVGKDASNYSIYEVNYEGSYINKLQPAELTITPKGIDFRIRRGYVDMKMYVEGADQKTNTAYYTGSNLPYYADTDAVGVTVELDCWINSMDKQFEDIIELGTYFATWEHVTIVSGSVDAKNYYISKHTICKLVVEKRRIEIDQPMDAAYTGATYVTPKYSIQYSLFANGEWESDITDPELILDESGLVGNVGGHGTIRLELADKTHYYMLDMMSNEITEISWEYDVMPGSAIITIDQIKDFYHREILTDYTDKIKINVETTDDPSDQVEILDVEWSVNDGYNWTSFDTGYPTADQLDRMMAYGQEIVIRVSTDYSTSGNFNWTQEEFRFAIEKAPVYARVTSYFTYDGNSQVPEEDEYIFYIYSVDPSNTWATHRPDLPDATDYIQGYYTSSYINAGTYALNFGLKDYIEDNYEVVIDKDATYTINKVYLHLEQFEDTTRTYGDYCYYNSAYYDGFVNGETWYSASGWTQTYQYNTIGFYGVDEDAWLDADELTTVVNGDGSLSAKYDTPAGHYYIRCILSATNYEASVQYSNLFVNPRVVTFRYFESEDAYLTNPEGGVKGDDIEDFYQSIYTYTYNGNEQYPYVVIDNLVNGDTINPLIYVDNKVNAGIGHLYVNNLNNANYDFTSGSACTFTIEKADLIVIPDSGISKIYGSEDPTFTYTLSNIIGDDEPVLTGKLSRVAGENVGNYTITLGSVTLTNDEVNNNYNVVIAETPVTFEITQKTITATFTNTTRTYTGSALNPEFNNFIDILPADVSYVNINFTGGNTIGSGNYTKYFELTGTKAGNYTLSTDSVSFTIERLTITYTLKVDGNNGNSVAYDGNSHTLTAVVTNRIGEDDVTINVLTHATETDAGMYTSNLQLAGNKAVNYKFADGENQAVWSINTGSVDYSKFNIYTGFNGQYDGNSHTITCSGSLPTGYTAKYYVANGNTPTSTVFTGATAVGSTHVAVVFEHNNNYDDVNPIFLDVVITQREVTINLIKRTYTYDGNGHLPEITLNNIVEGEESYVSEVWSTGHFTNATTGEDVSVTGLTGSCAGNYKLVGTTSFTLVINKKALTLTPDDKFVTYGDAIPTYTISATGLVNGETLEEVLIGTPRFDCDYKVGSPVGDDYVIGIKNPTALSANNYALAFGEGCVTVSQKAITVTYTSTHKTNTYGDSDNLLKIGQDMELNHYYIGADLVAEDTVEKVFLISMNTEADGTGTTINVNPKLAVGNYYLVVRGINANYTYNYQLGNDAYLEITKKALTVTADDKNIIYGDAVPAYTVSFDGFVNDETELVLGGKLVLACAYNQFDDATTYTIYASGYTSDNYDITHVNGTLTVSPKPITITIDNQSTVYGSNRANLTVTMSGDAIVNNDANVYALICNVDKNSNVGEYDITGEKLDNNYAITFVKGTYTVTKKALTVKADAKNITYGDAIPTYTATYSGFVNGQNKSVLGGELVFTCDYDQFDAIGTYTIIPSGLTSDNYDISFINDDVTVARKAITITIENKTSVYGSERAELTAIVPNGAIVNGDTNVYRLNCVVDNTSDVGLYNITGTTINTNYAITFENEENSYSVTKKALTITADNKDIIYGDVVPTYTVTYTGFVNEDASGVLGGELVFDCDYVQFSNVGTYTITPSGLTSANYDITFVNGTTTVAKKVVTLTWGTSTFVYDEEEHLPTATAGALVNGDRVIITVVGKKVVAGTYTATATGLSNDNYTLPANVTHQFTITKPATYDKPINADTVAETGLNLEEIFKNIDTTADDAKLDLTIGATTVTFNKEAIEAIAENANANFKFEIISGEDAKAIDKSAAAVFEISLEGITFENGMVTVTTDFVDESSLFTVAKLYYIDAEGNKVNMNAVFENGTVTFNTNHFSTFAVEYPLTVGTWILIIVLILGVIGGVVFFVLKGKKSTPATEVATEEKSEETTENAEEVKEETTAETSEEKAE